MLPVSQFLFELQLLISPVVSSNFAIAVLYIHKVPSVLLINTVKSGKNLGSDREKKKNLRKVFGKSFEIFNINI
jgi:hypothetical protein